MQTKEKCAHPSCDCYVAEGSDYCSTYCSGQGETPDVACSCGHASCEDNDRPLDV